MVIFKHISAFTSFKYNYLEVFQQIYISFQSDDHDEETHLLRDFDLQVLDTLYYKTYNHHNQIIGFYCHFNENLVIRLLHISATCQARFYFSDII